MLSEQKGIIQIGSMTLDAVIDSEPACTHHEITIEVSVYSDGHTVYCPACRKKIIIPEITLVKNENSLDSLIGIIAEVFGEEVGQRIARYA